ncbi:MAG: rod shape-determining protein RodA [Candidatus Omnitrophica bacterium]|nr:rod shape-determining protein RodA [Candidatus Omnitrophota bacterium]
MMHRHLRNFDGMILGCAAVIFVIGLVFLQSSTTSFYGTASSESFVMRQLISLALGLILGLVVFSIDYRKLVDAAYLLYGLSLFILMVTFFIGERRLGATRWVQIGMFSFQPSEFVKITFILALAAFLGRRKEYIQSTATIAGALLLIGPAFALIVIQPDLGTALILVPAMLAMVYVAGVNGRMVAALMAGGICVSPFFWHLLKAYQKKRLLVFLNPDLDPLGAGYTIIQSKIAVGSGQLFGKGWLAGTQSQLNFLPERHTDFIFSVVGEEWGFVGACVLLALYFVILYRGIRIAEMNYDLYGKVIAVGLVSLLGFQVIVNIGMTIGLLPVVGVTLPFISYGGSSLVVSILNVCLLLNVGMRRSVF